MAEVKQMNADVIVVAAGLSGLASSVQAAECGAKVITFEKAKTTGGAASMGMGPLAVGTKQQRLVGVNLSPDEAFLKHMHYTHWRCDAHLLITYYRKTASTIEWLEGMGVEFVFTPRSLYTPERMKYFASPEPTGHMVKPAGGGLPGPGGAATMTKALTDRASQAGVDILLETPVKKLIRKEGRIVGVMAESASGQVIQANAKAVIIATGGFGDNPEWIKKYLGFEWGKDLFSFRIPGLVGDGMRMAWEVGAAKTRLMMELMYQMPDNLQHFMVEGAFRQPTLWVNKLGKRFMPEDCIANTSTTGNAISEQPERTCFAIMDEDTLNYYKRHGVDVPGIHGLDVFVHFDEDLKKALDEGYKYVFVADSIEELARKTGIDAGALTKTVDEYNAHCAQNYDPLFRKDREFLRPVKTPKYYAAQSFPGAYGTLGGIKINYKMEVLTEDSKVIPGLYAVGTDANTLYGDTYPFVLPGNTMAFALNSGRIAAENAVEYGKSLV
jgi:fumarate reductase flavoprotein subunit